MKIKKNKLIMLFDEIIETAALDFLGTGSNSKLAKEQEDNWYDLVDYFKEQLQILINDTEKK